MNGLNQDFRFALRTIRKHKAASAVVILTLGIGLGANAVFFAAYHGMVLRPLPFAEPEELVVINESQPAMGQTRLGVSAANLEDWRHSSDVMEAFGAYRFSNFNLDVGERPERVPGARVSAELFPMFGVQPVLGRHFTAAEDFAGGPPRVLISHRIWRERFAADPAVIGRQARLDDELHEIVGVMPEGFAFPINGQVWTPLAADPLATPRDQRDLEVIARLDRAFEDAVLTRAQEELGAVAAHLAAVHPDTNRGFGVKLRRLRDAWLPPVTQMAALIQLALVGLVMLIVCANVTNILLAQFASRRAEHALRTALGASRGRLVRLALVESVTLSLAGGVVGMLIAAWGEVWIHSLTSVPIPYWLSFEISHGAVAYVFVLTVATGVMIGLLPAWSQFRRNLFADLKTGGRTEQKGGGTLRRALITAEYALALVVLTSALLMVRSFLHLVDEDPGFAREGVLTLQASLTSRSYDDPAARATYLERALEGLESLPGVERAAAVNILPIDGNGAYQAAELEVEGLAFPADEEPQVIYQAITEGYFEALDIPLLEGRALEAAEVLDGEPVALVSASLAELLWPGEPALERRLRPLGPAGDDTADDGASKAPWLWVIGVVGNVESGETLAGLGLRRPEHHLYVPIVRGRPHAMGGPRLPTFVVRGPAPPEALAVAVREELAGVDPAVPLFRVFTMQRVLTQFYFAQHIWSRMFSALAFVALLIAAVGAYGVSAYAVSRRLREMGIRLALGARPGRLLLRVLGRGAGLALGGAALGLLGAVPLAGLMASLLHGVEAQDPAVFGAVVAVLLGVGALASFFPARRAARIEPMRVLREE